MMRYILPVIVACLALWGCVPIGKNSSPVPALYIDELRVSGGTLLAGHREQNPNSTACSEDGVYVGNLGGSNFYFSPAPEYAEVEQYADLLSAQYLGDGLFSSTEDIWEPYNFYFSTQHATEFTQIDGSTLPRSDFNSQFEENEIPNSYLHYLNLRYPETNPEFILYGSYSLVSYADSLPVNATHVELWFRSTRDGEPELVHRVPLENLSAWRTFVQPYIDTSSGTAVCNLDIP